MQISIENVFLKLLFDSYIIFIQNLNNFYTNFVFLNIFHKQYRFINIYYLPSYNMTLVFTCGSSIKRGKTIITFTTQSRLRL